MIDITGYLLGVPNVEQILIWLGSVSTLFLEDEVRREIKHSSVIYLLLYPTSRNALLPFFGASNELAPTVILREEEQSWD